MRSYFLATLVFFFVGCSSAYYAGLEKFGYHKRDLLQTRVGSVKESQQEAKQQFRSALESFQSVITVQGGELQRKYDQLNRELELCNTRAIQVRSRIKAVEEVSEALFYEWENELDEYKSASLRRSSENQLRRTEKEYENLVSSMRRAESRMEPVLEVFNDHVLFLKHNLNARAVSEIRTELPRIQGEVQQLVDDMERSIKEANGFLETLES